MIHNEENIRKVLPKSINLDDLNIWSFDWCADGIESFRDGAIEGKKKAMVNLYSKDFKMQITLWVNPQKLKLF